MSPTIEPIYWIAFLAFIGFLLFLDLFVFHRNAHVVQVREAAIFSAFWIALGVAFGVLVIAWLGIDKGVEYYTGYLIEKSLSVDNVFVFALVFGAFAVPGAVPAPGAVLGRGGRPRDAPRDDRGRRRAHRDVPVDPLRLRRVPHLHRHPDGPLARQAGEGPEPEPDRPVRPAAPALQRAYDGPRFFTRVNAKRVATPLLLVLIAVEVTDLVFAVDSIPAIFAITTDPFIVYTSNAFAILGLRALYFLLADLKNRFRYLKLGLAVILVYVGVKLTVVNLGIKIDPILSLAIVATILAVSIVASWRNPEEPEVEGHAALPWPTDEGGAASGGAASGHPTTGGGPAIERHVAPGPSRRPTRRLWAARAGDVPECT